MKEHPGKELLVLNLLKQADEGKDFEANIIFEKEKQELIDYINKNFNDPNSPIIFGSGKEYFIKEFVHEFGSYEESYRKLKLKNSFLLLAYLVLYGE